MEVDEVIERIGGFGAAQKKVVCLVNLAQLATAFHALSYTFLAEAPSWHCPEVQQKNSCAIVGARSCAPKYSADFTSIVSEVGGHG
jgi:hypothetical protein